MTKVLNAFFLSLVFGIAAIPGAAPLHAQGGELPVVDRVDAQPLLLITGRLAEAMQSLGSPFTAEQMTTLASLKSETNDSKITASVQRMLDPMCIAAVEIQTDGEVTVSPAAPMEVAENGWRAMLVKVVNRAGLQSKLRVDSPNARPIPHGPQDDIENRWLALR